VSRLSFEKSVGLILIKSRRWARLLWFSMDDPDQPRDCDICGHRMRTAYVLPKLGPHKELRSFKCDNCGDVRTVRINGDEEEGDSG
jgi:hypothetical protein